MRFNRRHILILILALLVLAVFLPIPVRFSFVATAKIFPLKEWKLSRGLDEGFFSQTYDYETDALLGYRSYRFERGDIAELRISRDIRFDSLVGAGDTVAIVESFFLENEITRLKNLRDIEIANLKVLSTGEKQALIEQAARQYDYARQQLDLEKKNFARQEILFRDSVITAAEFDVHENTLALAGINARVAYDGLMALMTGQKDPVLLMSEQKIMAYQSEIRRLEMQKEQYTIITPFEGMLTYDPALGGVLRVSDNRRLVLRIPVPYQHSAYLKQLHAVRFTTPDNKVMVNAAFRGFEENVSLIQNQQFIIAKAMTVEGAAEGIYPGMVVSCRIYCDKVSIFRYLQRNFALSFRS